MQSHEDGAYQRCPAAEGARPSASWRRLAAGGVALLTVVGLGLGALVPEASDGSRRLSLPLFLGAKGSWCNSPDFTAKSLKSVVDATVFGLVPDIHHELKFEASGVVNRDHAFYVICDSSWEIPVFRDLSASGAFKDIHLEGESVQERNYLVSPEDKEAFPHGEDSQWEAITWDSKTDRYITVQESIMINGEYHAVLQEITISGKKWKMERACPAEFTFDSENKGFEGALGMEGVDGRFFVLGLCEGNHCGSGKVGQNAGNGMMVLMELDEGSGTPNVFEKGQFKKSSSCEWKTIKTINIPSSVAFVDYSDVARRGKTIAITSQESSALFLGEMTLSPEGLVDPETFSVGEGDVHYFPPNDNCEVNYCNVEGIDFISDHLLVGSSDQMKKDGRQAFTCLAKDQSMHVFALKR